MKRSTPAMLFLLTGLAGGAFGEPGDVVWASGFESGGFTWLNASTRTLEYDAPVEGLSTAVAPAGGDAIAAVTPVVLEAGKAYRLTAWARSVYDDAHMACLRDCEPEALPDGIAAEAVARIELISSGQRLAEETQIVSPTPIFGDPEELTNDDGANVWVDVEGGFRHAFAENHFAQELASDPIDDPWFDLPMPLAFDQDDMMAKGVAVFPDSARRVYGFNSDNPFCTGTGENCQAVLFAKITGDGDPLYDSPAQADNNYIAYNIGDEDPWLGDPHVFVDPETGRSWLTIGGGTGIYVAELDSASGFIRGYTDAVNFDQDSSAFTLVADWNGDEWTAESEWFEGGALYKHGGFWYLFTSNGSLAFNYTIRVGRGTSPTGPFLDKRGRDMARFDAADAEYGNSFLLGDDANQVVPGHAHVWEENGTSYLGYDYRTSREVGIDTEFDFMGIRRLRFVDGWPTIWTPISVTIEADDVPALVGQPLAVALTSIGEPGSTVAFDRVTIEEVAPKTDVGVLGDSITEGVFGTTYATRLAELLGDRFNVLEWEGRKGHGVSGATLVQNSYLPIWETGAFADLLASNPEIVTVMLGTNDASEQVPAGLRANYETDLNLLIATLEALPTSPEVVLCTPPPALAASPSSDSIIRGELIPIIERVAQQRRLRLININGRVTDYPTNWPDGLHPDAAGNENLAKLFFDGLSRPLCPGGWAPPGDTADFFDAIAFLRAADANEGRADIAQPYGDPDSSDVRRFISDLNAACP